MKDHAKRVCGMEREEENVGEREENVGREDGDEWFM